MYCTYGLRNNVVFQCTCAMNLTLYLETIFACQVLEILLPKKFSKYVCLQCR